MNDLEQKLKALPRPSASTALDGRIDALIREAENPTNQVPYPMRWVAACAVVGCLVTGSFFIAPWEQPEQSSVTARQAESDRNSIASETQRMMSLAIRPPKRPRLWGADSLTFQVDVE